MRKRQPISLGLFPWITETVHQLATNSNPPVMFQFREELLAEKVKPEVREAMESWAPREEALRAFRESATFEALAPDPRERVLTIARRLLQLHDLGVRQEHPVVEAAISVLSHSRRADGSLPGNLAENAFALWVLGTFEAQKTPLARALVRHLVAAQRGDRGWLDPELEPELVKNPESPSCPWTTLHVLLALTEFREQRGDLEIRKGAVLLLDRMFKRSHKSFFGHPDHWRELDYGYEGNACFKWAVPKILLVLGRLGCGLETKEVAELVMFLRKTLRPDARWGATVEGDDFLTLRVLRALMAAQQAGKP